MLLVASAAVVTLAACQPGSAEFSARMDALPGATRMSMRFTLQVKTRRRYRRVAAPGFGEWTTADPGVSRYSFTRRVEELIGPARYRVRVRFHWRDAAGTLVAFANRRSRACRQPDPRPDLTIEQMHNEDGVVRARVRNDGRSAAGPFSVRIGAAEVTLQGLGAGRGRWVETPGACEGVLTAEADPHDAVDERSERNNELAFACPPVRP